MTASTGNGKPNIQYPMAYRPVFGIAHISDAEKGHKYLCLGCHDEMIPRKGNIKRHHFAHKAGAEHCNPDNALHETAKAAICHGFLTAVQERGEYQVKFPCSRCRKPFGANVAIEGAAIATERSVVHGTRSDLVITGGDGKCPRVIIEIIVHHDVEEFTKERYIESGTPVLKVRPSWESVDGLREQTVADETLNVVDNVCRNCKETERRHREWLEGIKGNLSIALQAGRGRRETVPIQQDKLGSFLRADTRRLVNSNAKRLTAVGFAQQSKRPTLFRVDVNEWKIFADLDSTDVMRIWDVDCLPALYAFPDDPEPPRCKECVLDIVRGILEGNGVTVRRYFLDHGSHNHWTLGNQRRDELSVFG